MQKYEELAEAVWNESHDALQILWDNINKGQRKQLYKHEEIKVLLDRYGVKVE